MAQEVCDVFGVDRARVTRVYQGVDEVTPGDAARGAKVAGARRYVLALGTIEPRKNLPRLVRAFDAVAADDSGLHLVIAGPPGWGDAELAGAVDAAVHGSRIRRLGYVDDTARRDLLAGARVLAYPSRYEGFGRPPLEAMQAGVPVVASRAGAIPEVLGDAALLVEGDDTDALAGALEQLLSDDELRATLVTRGHARRRALHLGVDRRRDGRALPRRRRRGPRLTATLRRPNTQTSWRSSQPSSVAMARGSWRSR